MNYLRRLAGLVFFLALSRVALAQEIVIARPDSNGHAFTYRQHDLFWGRVYDRGRPVSLLVYESAIRPGQPGALLAFEQYQAHLKTVRKTALAFKLFAVAATLTSLVVGPGNSTAAGRQVLGAGIGAGVLGLSGFALYHRRVALKQLNASVSAIEP